MQIAMIKDEIARRGARCESNFRKARGAHRVLGGLPIDARPQGRCPRLDELHDRWLQARADLKICGQRPAQLPIAPTSPAPRMSLAFRRPVPEWPGEPLRLSGF